MQISLPPKTDDSVEFVQRKYEDEFAHNQDDLKAIWIWFHEGRAFFEAKAAYHDWDWSYGEESTYDDHDVTFPDEDYLTRYTDIVLEEVVKNNTPPHELPKPFELDTTRIEYVQESIARLEIKQCQIMVLNVIINQCEDATQPSPESNQQLVSRLQDINSFSQERSERLEMMAIEIVRTAYTFVAESSKIPDPIDVCQARDMLDTQTQAGHRVVTLARRRVHELISQHVFEEINGSNSICDLWPSQILKRYGTFIQPPSDPHQIDPANDMSSEIIHISQRIAHLILIQWRVWAQLLWFKPQDAIFASEEEYTSWQSEARVRVGERLSPYKNPSLEAYAESTMRNDTDLHASPPISTSVSSTTRESKWGSCNTDLSNVHKGLEDLGPKVLQTRQGRE